MYIRRIRIGLLTAMTGLLLTAPSYADKPQIVREMNLFDILIVDCGSFEVRTKGWERDTFKWWYDEFGAPLKVQVQIHITEGEYYNATDPEKTVSQGKNGVGENATIKFDFVSGAEHHSGAAFRLTIPGIGHVLLHAGTWIWGADGTFVHHGPDFAFAEGETGLALCEALK